jgi:hypothetical protein
LTKFLLLYARKIYTKIEFFIKNNKILKFLSFSKNKTCLTKSWDFLQKLKLFLKFARKIGVVQKTRVYCFFFFWKIHPKIKSRFGVFFAFRTKQSFWGVFCLQDKTVVLRYFLSWEQCSHFEDFFEKFETFLVIAPKK